jgi:hypothetical protein
MPVTTLAHSRNLGFHVVLDCLRESKFPFLPWIVIWPNGFFILGIACGIWIKKSVAAKCGGAALAGAVMAPIAAVLLQPDRQFDIGVGYYFWCGSFCLLTLTFLVPTPLGTCTSEPTKPLASLEQ